MTEFGTRQSIYVDRDYPTALEFLDTFFSHPEVEEYDLGEPELVQLQCYQMLCLFQLGREARAIDVGRSLLAIERRSHLRVALILMHDALSFLPNRDLDQMASVRLTEFIWDVAQAKRLRARRKLPSPATYAQLCQTWILSFPPKDRERWKEHWADIL